MSTRNCIDCRRLVWEFWDLACVCTERHWDSIQVEREAHGMLAGSPSESERMRVEFKRAETCPDFEPHEVDRVPKNKGEE